MKAAPRQPIKSRRNVGFDIAGRSGQCNCAVRWRAHDLCAPVAGVANAWIFLAAIAIPLRSPHISATRARKSAEWNALLNGVDREHGRLVCCGPGAARVRHGGERRCFASASAKRIVGKDAARSGGVERSGGRLCPPERVFVCLRASPREWPREMGHHRVCKARAGWLCPLSAARFWRSRERLLVCLGSGDETSLCQCRDPCLYR